VVGKGEQGGGSMQVGERHAMVVIGEREKGEEAGRLMWRKERPVVANREQGSRERQAAVAAGERAKGKEARGPQHVDAGEKRPGVVKGEQVGELMQCGERPAVERGPGVHAGRQYP
jgi:hypothetical protein